MVRFLIEEKVGAYMIDFLIVALLFSMWTLFLLNRQNSIPFISVTLSLVIATLSIIFVFVYREHSLYFFRPKQGFEAVAFDTKKSIDHVFKKRSTLGVSVTTYLKNKVDNNLQIISDFMDLLSAKKDTDFWYGSINLSSILSFYVTEKRFIDPQSGWFPLTEVPASAEGNLVPYELSQPFEEFALGERTISKPEMDWVEKQVLLILDKAQTTAITNKDILCIASLMEGYKNIIMTCFEHQEFAILDQTISELDKFATQIATSETPENLGEFYNIMLQFGEKLIRGLELSIHAVLANLTWQSEDEIQQLKLPKLLNEVLIEYQLKIEAEVLLEKRIVTPKEWIEKEILEKLTATSQEKCSKYFNQEFGILGKLFEISYTKKAFENAIHVLSVELLLLRRALILKNNALALKNIDKVMEQSTKGYDLLKEQKNLRLRILNEMRLGSLNSIKCRDKQIFEKFYAELTIISLKELENSDNFTASGAIKDLMSVSSLAFLYSEYYQDKELFDVVIDTLTRNRSLDRWIVVFAGITTEHDLDLSMKYHYWFKDIFIAISSLPQIPEERPPARSFAVVYDHPSKFIRKSTNFLDIEDCIKGMIEGMKERIVNK
jgi:hypothetical protein